MNDMKFSSHIPEPTEEEIEQTIEKVKEKYNVVMSKEDAIKYAKSYYDLQQWFLMEKNSNSSHSITKEMGAEIKSYIKETRGDDVSLDDAQGIAKESLKITIPREKELLANEIRAIIDKYK
jgi:hypothetical protein